jgi:hypothetical protein
MGREEGGEGGKGVFNELDVSVFSYTEAGEGGWE